MENAPKYRAGEIANLLDISIVALRNYEKLGLIAPARYYQNNYRQFDAIEFNLLRRARSYIGLGCSMREAVNLMLHSPLSDLAPVFHKKAEDLAAQIEREIQVLDFLRSRAEHLARISSSDGECFIENSPGMYVL